MEYDAIQIVNDFITEEELKRPKKGVNLSRQNEDINLLYVAITRTKNSIDIPEELLPNNFPKSPFIRIIRVPIEEADKISEQPKRHSDNNLKGQNILKEPFPETYPVIKKKENPAVEFISPRIPNNYVQIQAANNLIDSYGLSIGDNVVHHKFGIGKILTLEGNYPDTKATVMFDIAKQKQLMLKFAGLMKVA